MKIINFAKRIIFLPLGFKFAEASRLGGCDELCCGTYSVHFRKYNGSFEFTKSVFSILFGICRRVREAGDFCNRAVCFGKEILSRAPVFRRQALIICSFR
jgi:hypothetical protein